MASAVILLLILLAIPSHFVKLGSNPFAGESSSVVIEEDSLRSIDGQADEPEIADEEDCEKDGLIRLPRSPQFSPKLNPKFQIPRDPPHRRQPRRQDPPANKLMTKPLSSINRNPLLFQRSSSPRRQDPRFSDEPRQLQNIEDSWTSFNYVAARKLAKCRSKPGGCSCRDWISLTEDDGYKRKVSRICDGICDCPRCEDETGCAVYLGAEPVLAGSCQHEHCRQCPPGHRSCLEPDSPDIGCYTYEQQCDGISDCIRSRKDEKNCFKLDNPVSRNQTPFPVLPYGRLFRKISGKWLLVCDTSSIDKDVLAELACGSTTGSHLKLPLKAKKVATISIQGRPYAVFLNGEWREISRCREGNVDVICPPPPCGANIETEHMRRKRSVGNDETDTENDGGSDGYFRSYFSEFIPRNKRRDTFPGPALKTKTPLIGGSPTNELRFPWLALIRITSHKEARRICAGTIVHPFWVLSAAHCFASSVESPKPVNFHQDHYEVSAGLLRISSASPFTQLRSGTTVVIHEMYSIFLSPPGLPNTHVNDIALLKVNLPFIFNLHVNALCLPHPTSDVPAGSLCTISGWGSTPRHVPIVDNVREIDVPIWEDCGSMGLASKSSGKQFCGGFEDSGHHSCHGNPGAPVVCSSGASRVVEGIVSHGNGCAKPRSPGIFTKVAQYVPWIRRVFAEDREGTLKEKGLSHELGTCPGMVCSDGRCVLPCEMCDGAIDCPALGEDETKGCKLKVTSAILPIMGFDVHGPGKPQNSPHNFG